jgi:hypothetical protein
MTYRFLFVGFAALGLSACAGLTGPVIMGADAVGIYVTKPSSGEPADLDAQIPQHQTWCYSTMGEAQCFAHPQNVPPDRLINVDPPSAYPVDVAAYRQALIAKPVSLPLPATGQPIVIDQTSAVQVERATLKDEISRDASSPMEPSFAPPP